MGSQVKIYDLALKMTNLSGLKLENKSNPNGDIEINFSGLRPGENFMKSYLLIIYHLRLHIR